MASLHWCLALPLSEFRDAGHIPSADFIDKLKVLGGYPHPPNPWPLSEGTKPRPQVRSAALGVHLFMALAVLDTYQGHSGRA